MIRLIELLKEISMRSLFSKTPTRYKGRTGNISVKLKTISKNTFYYETSTNDDNGPRLHKQIIRQVPKKLAGDKIAKIYPITNVDEDVVVWCDCNDFKYENEYVLWKKNASHIVNSNGNRPIIKNPNNTIKLCKHLTAIMPEFIKTVNDIALKYKKKQTPPKVKKQPKL